MKLLISAILYVCLIRVSFPFMQPLYAADASEAPSAASRPEIDFGPYMANIKRRLKRAYNYPPIYGRKYPIIAFIVHKNGTVSDVKLNRSSGVAAADRAAIRAVKSTTMPPFQQVRKSM